jgi:hypothetical protein
MAQKSLDVEQQKGRVQRLQRHYVCLLEQLSLLSDCAKEWMFKDSAFSSIHLEKKIGSIPHDVEAPTRSLFCE